MKEFIIAWVNRIPPEKYETLMETRCYMQSYVQRVFHLFALQLNPIIVFTTVVATSILSSVVSFSQEETLLHELYRARERNFQSKYEETFSKFDSIYTHVGDFLWGQCTGVALKDSFAFIGNGAYVHVLNVAEPDSPRIVGEYLTSSIVNDLTIRDSLAYVLTGNKLLILNICNPYQPTKVSETVVTTAGGAVKLVIEGSFIYLTSFVNGLRVVDVSNPTQPIVRGSFPLGDRFAGHAVKGGYVYVGYQISVYLDLIDARNPDSLRFVGFIQTPGRTPAVYAKDTLLFAGGRSPIRPYVFFQVFSIADPQNPVELSIDSIDNNGAATPTDIRVKDSIAFITTTDSGVYTYDVTDPRNPMVLGHLRRPYAPIGSAKIDFANNIIAVASNTGLWLVRAARPESLQTETFFITGYYPFDLTFKDHYALVTHNTAGLAILDVSDPSTPKRVSALETPRRTSDIEDGRAKSIAVNGNYAYITTGYTIEIVDVRNIFSPKIVGYVPLRFPGSIIVQSNQVYVAQYDSGVSIFDVSDPIVPQKLGSFNLPLGVNVAYLAIQDSILVLATLNGGLRFVNVARPSQPQEVSLIQGFASGVVIGNNLVYTVIDTSFKVYSLEYPNSPSLIGQLGFMGFSYTDMDVSDNFVYVQTFAIDVSDPTNPNVKGYLSGAFGIAANGPYLYYTDDFSLHIMRNNLITSVPENAGVEVNDFVLYQNYPNPFNSRTDLRFGIRDLSTVILGVYDMLGREVTILVNEKLTPGNYAITWDANGMASGVYLYRLVTEKFTRTRKMILLK